MKKILITNRAFTLAEIIIVLAVLGIVTAITVPSLVRNYIEQSNRAKIKKSMSVYDTALNKMIVENGIKGVDSLYSGNNAFAPKNNCRNSSQYFKINRTLDSDNGTNCRFRAPDGVFWDISNITKPIISLKENDLNISTALSDTNRAFYLVGHFDNNGTLRVNDLVFEKSPNGDFDNADALSAIYDFIAGKTKTSLEKVSLSMRDYSINDILSKLRSGELAECKNCDPDDGENSFDESLCDCRGKVNIEGDGNSDYFVTPHDEEGNSITTYWCHNEFLDDGDNEAYIINSEGAQCDFWNPDS